MKKVLLVLLAISTMLAFSSCGDSKKEKKKSHKKEMVADDEEDEDAGDERVERSDYTFTAKLIADEEGTASNIIVHMDMGNGEEQVEECEPLPLDTASWTGFAKISEEDANFDGFPDLQVCLGPFNACGNFTYALWLWDDDNHKFVRVEGFDELSDPVYNAAEKEVLSTFRMFDEYEDDCVYSWDGFKLVKEKCETIVYDEMEEE